MKESDFQFLGYRVSNISLNIKNEYNPRIRNFSQNVDIHLNFSQENKRFVEVALNISIENESKDFSFFISIKGGFQAHENMTDDLFQTMSKQNAPAILYPFARAIITNYTVQANIPPIILPAINFADKNRVDKISIK
ncbi:MAG: hypothetical protein GF353_07125 [Candidatus Lokiarchaeota archaeon]|nr:hypothetical protein [Candidatus Lokiarchaeota archaeon]